MRPRGDDDAKVRQIRDAARTLFLRDGYAQVSTAALAKEAGVSKETLYSRYPGKHAVLADLLKHLISVGGSETRVPPRLEEPGDLEDALTGFANDLAAHLMQRDYLELARIVIAETPRLPHVGEIFRQAVPERALSGVEALLANARRAGLVRDVDLPVAARMFVGPIVIAVLTNGLLRPPSDDDRPAAPPGVAAHVALFLDAVTDRGAK